MATTLSRRALNRTLLGRQGLLRQEEGPVATMIERLVGLQAQNPTDPYYALWSRLAGFKPGELMQLLVDRQAARTWAMRKTVHLLTARDCLRLLPLMQPVWERTLQSGFGRHLEDLDREEVAAFSRKLLEEKPRTRGELIPMLRERWPDHDPEVLGYAATIPLPLVQLPPRGLWGETGRAVLTTPEAWLDQPLETNPSPDEVVLRYLAAFGPAGNADIRTWSGWTGVREITERLRPRLRTFRDENGRELFDLPEAPHPDPDVPAPPRFLPEFDNVFLSHEDRSRVIDPDVRVAGITVERTVRKLLVDGFVNAEWTITREGPSTILTIEPYKPLPNGVEAQVVDEGARLLVFVAPDTVHDVRITSTPT